MSDNLYKTLFPETDWTNYESAKKCMDSPLFKAFASAKSDFTKKKIMKVLNMEYELDRIKSLKNLRSYELDLKAQ